MFVRKVSLANRPLTINNKNDNNKSIRLRSIVQPTLSFVVICIFVSFFIFSLEFRIRSLNVIID